MKISLITSYLSPAAGGLSAAVSNLSHALVNASVEDLHVVGIEDPDDPRAADSWGPHVHAHCVTGPRAFGYAPQMMHSLDRLAHDVTDVQGLWTYPSLANLQHHRRFGTPYIVTPHGMLDPWALQRSRWKKRTVRLFFEDAHLAGATCLRATAEMEAGHFRSFGLRNPIAIVPNGVSVPHALPARPKGQRRRMLFLSRIHPKKGIAPLLRAWAAIETVRPEWELIIAGPDEVGHTAEMQTLARSLNLRRVEWRTAVHGEDKSVLYRSADCFVLPTHAENFGLVIAEALAHEVPVITTRNAPWEGLHRHKCGWWIDLDDARLRDTLLEATAQTRQELWEMGARGRNWMSRDFAWDSVGEKMAEVYRWVLAGGNPPEYIYGAYFSEFF